MTDCCHGFGDWLSANAELEDLPPTMQEAFDLLLPASERFPKHWLIPYNLACYTAQLGRTDESEKWFKTAMALNEHEVKRIAIDDPDLTPLWDAR